MHYLEVKEHVAKLAVKSSRSPSEITIISVTKMHPLDDLLPAYEAGCRDFGESRIQEALPKMEKAPHDIRWHFIGTLQKNKVHKAIGCFALIHSVDSLELAYKISEVSQKENLTTPVLLQVNTSHEPTKHGLTPEEWRKIFERVVNLKGIELQGLMTMAPLTEDLRIIHRTFAALRLFKEELAKRFQAPSLFKHLSMGMSHDYPIAIEEGATLLRIGTSIFGERIQA